MTWRKMMTRYKDQCIEVQQKLYEYLEDMTNNQAIAKINQEYGPSHAFACANEIKKFQDEDTETGNVYHIYTNEDVKYPNKKKVRSS